MPPHLFSSPQWGEVGGGGEDEGEGEGRAIIGNTMGTGLTVVVLAAGEGKRMRSRRPKVLHRLGGRPLIAYPVNLARRLGGRLVLVVGPAGEEIRQALGGTANVHFVEQKERLGPRPAPLPARGAR